MNCRREKLQSAHLLLLMFAVTFLSLGQPARAQQVTAAITGQVVDPSGAAIIGAKVTARDLDRGTVWDTETNSQGFYNLPRVPVGKYEIRAEATGFRLPCKLPSCLS